MKSSGKAPTAAHATRSSAPRSPAGAKPNAPEAPVAAGTRPPDMMAYAPLLQHDLFRPLVTPPHPGKKHEGGVANLAITDKKEGPDTWHGWRFNGLAQLSGTTYALVEQPDKKRSNFLKEGDLLEDGKLLSVSADEIVLKEPAGGVARVRRVDAMAELLRATQHPGTAATTPASGPTGTVGGGPGALPPGGTIIPQGGTPAAAPAPPELPNARDQRRQQRRMQRSQATPGEE